MQTEQFDMSCQRLLKFFTAKEINVLMDTMLSFLELGLSIHFSIELLPNSGTKPNWVTALASGTIKLAVELGKG